MKTPFLNQLAHQKILPILRFGEPINGKHFCEMLLSYGFDILEITRSSHNGFALVKQLTDAGHCVGMGTIYNVEHAQKALRHGAHFLVSPGLSLEVASFANTEGIPYFPGVLSPTEVMTAIEAGLDTLKLFPASTVGPGYLKHLKGPFPGIHWLPTGGIAFDNVPDYLQAGALVVGQGTRLVNATHLASGNWQAIEAELRELSETLNTWRKLPEQALK